MKKLFTLLALALCLGIFAGVLGFSAPMQTAAAADIVSTGSEHLPDTSYIKTEEYEPTLRGQLHLKPEASWIFIGIADAGVTDFSALETVNVPVIEVVGETERTAVFTNAGALTADLTEKMGDYTAISGYVLQSGESDAAYIYFLSDAEGTDVYFQPVFNNPDDHMIKTISLSSEYAESIGFVGVNIIMDKMAGGMFFSGSFCGFGSMNDLKLRYVMDGDLIVAKYYLTHPLLKDIYVSMFVDNPDTVLVGAYVTQDLTGFYVWSVGDVSATFDGAFSVTTQLEQLQSFDNPNADYAKIDSYYSQTRLSEYAPAEYASAESTYATSFITKDVDTFKLAILKEQLSAEILEYMQEDEWYSDDNVYVYYNLSTFFIEGTVHFDGLYNIHATMSPYIFCSVTNNGGVYIIDVFNAFPMFGFFDAAALDLAAFGIADKPAIEILVSGRSGSGWAYKGQPISVMPTAAQLVGKNFVGWFTDAGFTQAFNAQAPITESITLYPKYVDKVYTVYAANDEFADISVTHGNVVEEPVVPAAPTGKYFVCWCSDEELTAPYDFTAPVTGDLTLYPKFEYYRYDVTFAADDVQSTTVRYGLMLAEPASPSAPEGQHFVEWCSDEELTTAYDFNTAVLAGFTLYPKFAANVYTVTFDVAGIPSQRITHGQIIAAPNAPTAPTGHHFAGWCSDDLKTIPFDVTAPVTGDLTLFADFDKNTYTVSFYINGEHDYTDTVEYGTVYEFGTNEDIGEHFGGWFTDEELTEAYDFENDDVIFTLYGKLALIKHTVKVNGEDVEVNHGSAFEAPKAPEKPGFAFDGWYLDENFETAYDADTAVTANMQLFPKYAVVASDVSPFVTFGEWLANNHQWLFFVVLAVLFAIGFGVAYVFKRR